MSKRIWYVYITLVIIYTLLTLLVPTPADVLDQYGLTQGQFRLVAVALIIPIIAIFFAAFYGYDKFKHYARTISSSPDGRAFNHIANGLGVIAVGLPAGSILATFMDWVTKNSTSALPETTIISNYFSLIYLFAAFWLIYKGSYELVGTTSNGRKNQNQRSTVVAVIALLLAVLFTYFTFRNPNRQVPTGSVEEAAFYLPDWLILTTIVIPYVFMWAIGLYAAVNIGRYSQHVKGILYRQILQNLAKGLTAIIIVIILLEFLVSFTYAYSDVSLVPALVIVYLLLMAIAVGFIFVAAGAKRLQKIEEV